MKKYTASYYRLNIAEDFVRLDVCYFLVSKKWTLAFILFYTKVVCKARYDVSSCPNTQHFIYGIQVINCTGQPPKVLLTWPAQALQWSLTHKQPIPICFVGYSGSDMTNLCKEAALGPVRDIQFEEIETIAVEQVRPIQIGDFTKALKQVRASVDCGDLDSYLSWNSKFGSWEIQLEHWWISYKALICFFIVQLVLWQLLYFCVLYIIL